MLDDSARKATGSSSGYSSNESCFASFLPAHLPTDWRAYAGLDILALSSDEWNTLPPGVRTVIRQWVILGGVLDLYYSGPAPDAIRQELGVEGTTGDLALLGAGRVRSSKWDGKELTGEQWRYFKEGAPGLSDLNVRHNTAETALTGANRSIPAAGLRDALGIRSFAAWQVGLILLLFGVVVGPVNLFYLAGPGRRHRLFFTTPVIALAASAVLIAVIFLQDGAGGADSGRRWWSCARMKIIFTSVNTKSAARGCCSGGICPRGCGGGDAPVAG